MSKIKLKPCPFCGAKAMIDFDGGNNNYFNDEGQIERSIIFYTVRCSYCLANVGRYTDPKIAVKAWNRRVEHE